MYDSESPNSAEYIYEKKNKGRIKLQRVLMITAYVVFMLAYFLFCYISRIIPLFAIAPLLLYIFYLLTWRFVKYDCYWEFRSGALEVGTVSSGRFGKKRRPRVSLRTEEAVSIYAFESYDDLSRQSKIYDFSESPDSDKRICIIFEREGISSALIIEGTAKLARLLSAFSKNAHGIKDKTFHG